MKENKEDTPQTPEWEEIAKEIVGKWGYEEEYWWKPIAESLSQAEERGRRRGIEEERQEWIKGNRCSNCGDLNLNSKGLSDICERCIEEE